MLFRPITLLLLLHFSITARSARVDTIRVQSRLLNKEMKSVVVVPSQVASGTGKFPVLYLLHGLGGNYALCITKMPELAAMADRYGVVVVCPDAGFSTIYFDYPPEKSIRFSSYFTKELMPYIAAHYPIKDERASRSITGMSMGGFGAFLIASHYPELFASAGSMSGVLDLQPFGKNSKLYKDGIDSSCCQVNWNRLASGAINDSAFAGIRLIVDCGLQDYLLNVNRKVHLLMQEKRIPHDYTERPGLHDWDYWRNALDYQLLFFSKSWKGSNN